MDTWSCLVLILCSSNEAEPLAAQQDDPDIAFEHQHEKAEPKAASGLATAQGFALEMTLPSKDLDFPAKGAHQSPEEVLLYASVIPGSALSPTEAREGVCSIAECN